MKALTWDGVNAVAVREVPEPRVEDPGDLIVKVTRSATCGSDLPLLGGDIPFMMKGDILGHEFLGEVVETGPAVTRHQVGERVVVASFIACGSCWYCTHGEFALCDNTNPSPAIAEQLWGFAPGGCFGCSHALGGWAGSHAEYVRVPFGDHGAFTVPDGVSDERAVFASDAAPAGWMGAELGGVRPGDVVAVWGAGAVGQMAARAAALLGAEQVVVIDRYAYRLEAARTHLGCETLDYDVEDISGELRERTGGRGADVCLEAVGMEAHGKGPAHGYDQVEQQLGLRNGRPPAVREAIANCRKGGSVFVLGVFGGFVDTFPLGALMHKGITLRAAQQHGQRFIPMLLDRMARDEIVTEYFATHTMPLSEGARGYEMFKERQDGNLRTVFLPHA